MSSEIDRVASLYESRLGGGGSFELPSPTPASELEDRPAEPVGAYQPPQEIDNWVDLDNRTGRLDGIMIVLEAEQITRIRAIVAEAIALKIEKSLDEWRDKHALHKKG